MILPQGTRDVLPPEWTWRQHLRVKVAAQFSSWGYQGVELPALETAPDQVTGTRFAFVAFEG